MTARTARVLRTFVVKRTMDDHEMKCLALAEPCRHLKSGTLACARAVEAGLEIGKKRATLDLQCPYSFEDYAPQIEMLDTLAKRILMFSKDEKQQVREAFERIADEISRYAHRNPMEVIAEASVLPGESQEV